MSSHPRAFPPFSTPAWVPEPESLTNVRSAFLAHKYLLLAILNCLRERQRPRQVHKIPIAHPSSLRQHWHEPSVERIVTPCIILRKQYDQGNLSVSTVQVEKIALNQQPISSWMRSEVASTIYPDRDTLHLAIASTMSGVPILVHTVGADDAALTHVFYEGVWSRCANANYMLLAIRYAQLVATSPSNSTAQPLNEVGTPCDLVALGQRYDHIAVHAALSELRAYRGASTES